MADIPYTNYKIRYSKHTGEVLYAKPSTVRNHDTEDLNALYDDYIRMSQWRQKYLRIRVYGEKEFITLATAQAAIWKGKTLSDEHVRHSWEARTKHITTEPTKQLFLPTALAYGLLTDTKEVTRGQITWHDICRYDYALRVCVFNALLSVGEGSNAWRVSTFTDSYQRVAMRDCKGRARDTLRSFDNSRPIDYMRLPIDDIARIQRSTGRAVLDEIYNIFDLRGDTNTTRECTANTVRAWGLALMKQPHAERHGWLMTRFRTAIMSHFLVNGGRQATEIVADEDTRDFSDLWACLADDRLDRTAGTTANLKAALTDFVNVLKGRAVRSAFPHIVDNGIDLGSSLFYAPVIMPLVITVASLFVYLDLLRDGLVIPGTETLTSRKYVEMVVVPTAPNADLVSYTVFIIHHMNMTLGGNLGTDGGGALAADWAPESMQKYKGGDIKETAINLIGAWKSEPADEGAKWIRALRATMLVVDGNPAE